VRSKILYRKHVGRVHGAVLRIVGMDHARAEELTQEAFCARLAEAVGLPFRERLLHLVVPPRRQHPR
jgi:hypothetical protein